MLEQRQPFAADVLRFYGALLPVQQSAFDEACALKLSPDHIGAYAAQQVAPRIAAVTLEVGPQELRDAVAQRMGEAGPDALITSWMCGDAQPAVDRYLARAALSPVLEALQDRAAAAFPGSRGQGYCPRCGGPPQLSYFPVASDDVATSGRRLLCARCHFDWSYPPMSCPACSGTSESQVATSRDAVFPHITIDGCDRCKSYVLNIDLTADGHAVPLVDEMSAWPLDLYARDHGLTKITPNLMGF